MKSLLPAVQTKSTPDLDAISLAIHDAREALDQTRQKCLIAGQLLNALKAALEADPELTRRSFEDEAVALGAGVSMRTLNTWMRAARNVFGALQEGGIDIEVEVLLLPEERQSPDQRKLVQSFFDFTDRKTFKECLDKNLAYGGPDHNVDRAINGQTKGGVGKQPDRLAFEKFTATKLKHITTFLTIQSKIPGTAKKRVTGWRNLSPGQKTAISAAFILFLHTAPNWLLDNLADQIKVEARLSDAERLTR